ncbi:DUF4097 family beta strand repeat-containing protein [Aureibaculum conchae]|uniref:hypothetical protein n=1 Tax=Aureibaculum sp. 2308TA14-22 TaxID=3108392 RepID=UPI003395C47A
MRIIFYIYFLLLAAPVIAQKTIVKEIDFNNQKIEIQLEDIDLLEIVNTDKQKVSLSMQDHAENPTQIEIKNSEKTIAITASTILPIVDSSKMDKFCYEQPLFSSYKLMIPKGCEVLVVYHKGNFSTKNFTGNMNVRLNTGDLTIDDFNGSINIESFSGNIDATINDTEAIILSSKGRITTAFSSTNWERTAISLKGTLGKKSNLLTIQSVNANIMLNSGTTE